MAAYLVAARSSSASASAYAPCSRISWPRCTAHWPVKATRPGWESHQVLRACVHSPARPRSETSWQASIAEQYTSPENTAETSPASTATIASSSTRSPSATRPE